MASPKVEGRTPGRSNPAPPGPTTSAAVLNLNFRSPPNCPLQAPTRSRRILLEPHLTCCSRFPPQNCWQAMKVTDTPSATGAAGLRWGKNRRQWGRSPPSLETSASQHLLDACLLRSGHSRQQVPQERHSTTSDLARGLNSGLMQPLNRLPICRK